MKVNDLVDFQSGSKKGTWVNEVSSLIYDPSAASEERWQIYWHHYMSVGDKGAFNNGWIGYKGASTPQGLTTAKEVKLFTGRAYNKANDDAASENRPPVAGPSLVQADKLHDDLSYCVAFTEPGALATADGTYLALNCLQPKTRSVMGLLGMAAGLGKMDGKNILLKCDAPCHPANPGAWKYAGTMLTDEDAKSCGYKGFSAPDLFLEENRAYLLISPVSDAPVDNAYNGCFVIPFADLVHGALARDASGRLEVNKHIEGSAKSFNGACTYQPSVPGSGFMYEEISFGDKPFFQIFQTGVGR